MYHFVFKHNSDQNVIFLVSRSLVTPRHRCVIMLEVVDGFLRTDKSLGVYETTTGTPRTTSTKKSINVLSTNLAILLSHLLCLSL